MLDALLAATSDLSAWHFWSLVMVVCGVSAALALGFIDAPYGRFSPDGFSAWGPLIPARLGWCVQESPALLIMLAVWYANADSIHGASTPAKVLASMFCFHYVVRAWIFPFLLNQSKPSPLMVVVTAFIFCTCNGLLQGTYLFVSPDSLIVDGDAWLASWRVRVGIALFFFGWAANQHADYVLRHLRDPRPEDEKIKKDGGVVPRYRIPHGGLWNFTSAANYTGEMIEWAGFALAAWSVPATTFFIFTMLNLGPRAISYHSWYKKTFPNYPKNRKAFIPFLL